LTEARLSDSLPLKLLKRAIRVFNIIRRPRARIGFRALKI